MEELKLSTKGIDLYNFSKKYISEQLKKFNNIRTQVFYPGDEGDIYNLELAKILDQIIGEFDIKKPFYNKSSEYFNFMKDTALNIMRMKISNESASSYIFVSQGDDNRISFIIRDSAVFGITKISFGLSKGKLVLESVEHLPSNSYTNPIFPVKM